MLRFDCTRGENRFMAASCMVPACAVFSVTGAFYPVWWLEQKENECAAGYESGGDG